jgi:hypothetical protein
MIKFSHNGKKYQFNGLAKEANRFFNREMCIITDMFSENGVAELNDKEFDTFMTKFSHRVSEPVDPNAATAAQLKYISDLGVKLTGKSITKKTASKIIDAVLSGEGVGSFGLEFFSGSN